MLGMENIIFAAVTVKGVRSSEATLSYIGVSCGVFGD
jgi:hypothetical protein